MNVLDYATTVLCTELLQGEEANPVARELMEEGLYDHVKLLPSVAAVIFARPAARMLSGRKAVFVEVLTATAFLLLAVVNNTILLLGFEQPEFFRALLSTLYG